MAPWFGLLIKIDVNFIKTVGIGVAREDDDVSVQIEGDFWRDVERELLVCPGKCPRIEISTSCRTWSSECFTAILDGKHWDLFHVRGYVAVSSCGVDSVIKTWS